MGKKKKQLPVDLCQYALIVNLKYACFSKLFPVLIPKSHWIMLNVYSEDHLAISSCHASSILFLKGLPNSKIKIRSIESHILDIHSH